MYAGFNLDIHVYVFKGGKIHNNNSNAVELGGGTFGAGRGGRMQ